MNDLANIVAKFLPIGLIAGLFAIFYLLDVFSVRPNSDAASATRASVAQPAPTSGQPASSQPATGRSRAVQFVHFLLRFSFDALGLVLGHFVARQ